MDFKEIFEQAKANQRKLNSCPKHSFTIDLTPTRVMGKRWKCANCGGEIEGINKSWYEDGLKHGGNIND